MEVANEGKIFDVFIFDQKGNANIIRFGKVQLNVKNDRFGFGKIDQIN